MFVCGLKEVTQVLPAQKSSGDRQESLRNRILIQLAKAGKLPQEHPKEHGKDITFSSPGFYITFLIFLFTYFIC